MDVIVARTEVGITEWAGRVHRAVTLHRATAHELGRRIGDAAIGTRHDLLDRARRHGWCADEWTTVAPLLHDVDAGTVAPSDDALETASGDLRRAANAAAALDAASAVAAQLGRVYRRWRSEASSIADAPYRHVIDRVLPELAEAASV